MTDHVEMGDNTQRVEDEAVVCGTCGGVFPSLDALWLHAEACAANCVNICPLHGAENDLEPDVKPELCIVCGAAFESTELLQNHVATCVAHPGGGQVLPFPVSSSGYVVGQVGVKVEISAAETELNGALDSEVGGNLGYHGDVNFRPPSRDTTLGTVSLAPTGGAFGSVFVEEKDGETKEMVSDNWCDERDIKIEGPDGTQLSLEFVFNDGDAAQEAAKDSSGAERVKCDECGQTFKFKLALRKHINRAHPGVTLPEPVDCEKCGKVFYDTKSYQMHLDSHLYAGKKSFACDLCGESFPFPHSLSTHKMRIQKARKPGRYGDAGTGQPYRCETCGETFLEKWRYDVHVLTHSDDRYHCDMCGKAFSRKSALAMHERTHEDSKVFKWIHCGMCCGRFRNNSDLDEHRKDRHAQKPERTTRCKYCGKKFNTMSELQNHVVASQLGPEFASSDSPADAGEFHCDICPRRFKTKAGLGNHKRAHSESWVHCDTCCGSFRTHGVLALHKLEIHTEDERLSTKCKGCGETFGSLVELRRHAAERFQCELCPRAFKTERGLIWHITRHEALDEQRKKRKESVRAEVVAQLHSLPGTEGEFHECNFCGETFTRLNDLISHKRGFHEDRETVSPLESHLEMDIKPVDLPESIPMVTDSQLPADAARFGCGCGKTYVSAKSLHIHETAHCPMSKVKLECQECGETFAEKWRYDVHVLTHSEEKHHCDQCDQTFSRKSALDMHVSRAHREEPQQGQAPRRRVCVYCDKCCRVFETQWDLMDHKMEKHNRKSSQCQGCGFTFPRGSGQSGQLEKHVAEGRASSEKDGGAYFRCDKCDQEFTTHGSLARHVSRTHDKSALFSCRKCGKKFTSILYLTKHRKNVHAEKLIECDFCGEIFTEKIVLQEHRSMQHTGEKTIECDLCDERFLSRKQLQLHKAQHPVVIRKCNYCKETYQTKSDWEAHERTHTHPHQCVVCHKRFINSWDLQEHFATHPHCDECGKGFLQPRQLSAHQRMYGHTTRAKPRVHQGKCEVCDKTFTELDLLIEHKTSKRFSCPVCSTCFASKDGVRKHTRMCHPDYRPFQCDECDEAFTNSDDLKQHQKEHARQRDHTCDLCDAEFTSDYEMYLHRKWHEQDENIKCYLCDKDFASETELETHMSSHDVEFEKEKFECDLCDEVFGTEDELCSHLRKHGKKPEFKCDLCDEGFYTEVELCSHLSQHNKVTRTTTDETDEAAETFECDLCDRVFSSEGELFSHMSSHN